MKLLALEPRSIRGIRLIGRQARWNQLCSDSQSIDISISIAQTMTFSSSAGISFIPCVSGVLQVESVILDAST